MSEICLDCLNKISGKNDGKMKYILSRDLDLCEECGELKRVVIVERWVFYRRIFGIFLLPFYILYFLWRLLILPYLIIKYRKKKKH